MPPQSTRSSRSPRQVRVLIDELGPRPRKASDTRLSTLTSREVEVLRYIARGMSRKEIASLMHLSVRTVECHCTNLMTKLNIHDRVQLARFAIREGLVHP